MTKLFLAFALLLPAWAAAHGHSDDDGPPEAALQHFARIAELAPDVTAESSVSVPFVKISGQKVYMNGPFWELVQGWIRLYYRDIQHECDACVEISEDEFTRQAQDYAARNFLQAKVAHPAMEGVEHIAVGTADIGSQLGKTAAVAKITAEVAETVVSKFVGGGGVHLVCHILDAIILFGTRHIQTATRAFTWAHTFDRTSTRTWLRMGFVSSVVRRAQKKVRFATGPVSIDQEELHELDEEGPNRWWGWVKDGKRAKWMNKLAAADKPLKLSQREFLGGRMKRYLWLKGRKRGHSTFMKGGNELDKSLNHSIVWILEVQESMIQRAFESDGEPPEKALSLAAKETPEQEEIRTGLAREFSKTPEQAQLFEGLMRDVEVVFNANVKRKIRYFQAAKLEALAAGFIYGRYSAALAEKGDMYGNSFMGISRQVKFHWRAGRFGSYILEWADFLRLASLETDPARLIAHKYEALESLMRILKTIEQAGEVSAVETESDLRSFEQKMAEANVTLNTFTPWKEKRSVFSWIPFRSPKPRCSQLDKEAI